MKGNFHVQFLGGGAAVTPPCYPARGAAMRPSYPAGRIKITIWCKKTKNPDKIYNKK
jgi:hypothetical protein